MHQNSAYVRDQRPTSPIGVPSNSPAPPCLLTNLVKPSTAPNEPDIRMANATIQQHLAALRMFYDFLGGRGALYKEPIPSR